MVVTIPSVALSTDGDRIDYSPQSKAAAISWDFKVSQMTRCVVRQTDMYLDRGIKSRSQIKGYTRVCGSIFRPEEAKKERIQAMTDKLTDEEIDRVSY